LDLVVAVECRERHYEHAVGAAWSQARVRAVTVALDVGLREEAHRSLRDAREELGVGHSFRPAHADAIGPVQEHQIEIAAEPHLHRSQLAEADDDDGRGDPVRGSVG
jgi:hypothetical protein